MYIGHLTTAPAFFHRGTKLPFPPDEVRTEGYTWNWDTVYDTGVDVELPLERTCFVGSVRLQLAEDSSILSLEVLADGRPVGSLDASRTPVRLGISGMLTGELVVPVGVTASCLTLRIGTCLKALSFAVPEILGAYEDEKPVLWPTPASYTAGKGAPVRAGTVTSDGSADAVFAADELAGRLSERLGLYADPDGVPVKVCLDAGFTGERYRVEIAPEGITLSAGARLPLLYAVETLLGCAKDGAFPPAVIDDKPYKPMRGFHIMLPPRDQLGFARRVLRYVLVPMRYNQIILEFAGGMRFDRHPEISEAWVEGNIAGEEGRQPPFPHGRCAGGRLLEKDEVRAFVSYARSLGLEVIPEVQSFGHVQYITYAHPEIAEREEKDNTVKDTRGEDARPSEFYAHCYCPSMDESYRIIYDIIDEIVEVVQPERFVHMGHDEIYQIGICPRCRDKDPADLYVKHVTAMHDYLARKGLRMMIWSDMLQPTEKRYRTSPARGRIPQDIIMLDFIWYFHFDIDMEDHLLPYGYEVGMGNLYSSHYPRYSSRAAKPNMIGGEVSTWCMFNEYNLAKKGKFWDVEYTAEMLWNPDYDEGLREVYNRILAQCVQPVQRDEMHAAPRGLYAAQRSCLPLPQGDQTGIPAEILAQYPAAIRADGACVPVKGTCRRLIFSHTTLWNLPRIAWAALPKIGAYTVRYADGETVEVPVEYNGNILVWNRRYAQPLPQQYYRHQGYVGTWWIDPVFQGKTADGGDVLVTGFVWENPRPEAEIAEVCYHAAASDAAIAVLAAVEGV